MSGGSGDYQEEGDESYKRDVIPTASWHRWAAIELKRFDLGTSDVDRYEGKDGDDADADEEEEASQADDRSTQGMEDWGHSRFDLGTSDVEGYECENGDDAGADEEEYVLQADDWSMQNVEDRGHSTRQCEDWTEYFRPIKYDNGQANARASDVSEAETLLQ